MSVALLPGRLMLRRLLELKNTALSTPKSWTATATLTEPAIQNMKFCKKQLTKWNGQSFIPETPELEIFKDSSDNSWGVNWVKSLFKDMEST
ncbi:hypothetical protein AYI69_g7137 [Smittium culicis]|uniref:Uncharacterized protein n=1 Tax=Smittium culicis TaxID=133412 RepID=A0A1R1XUE0_9FUNG|nr:hypothetical protein AYI69_g7137 [Smittium culicis]